MADLALYLAEFSLIGSITMFAHSSYVLLATFISMPHFFILMIIFGCFMWFYLLAWKLLPVPKRAFKYLYWKYVAVSILFVGIVNGDATLELFVLTGLLILVLNDVIIHRRGRNLRRQIELQRALRDIIVSVSNSGVASSRAEMLAICGFCGLILMVFLNFAKLLCFLCVLSYISFQWYAIEIGFEQLDLPITIPIPFDMCCLLLCHAFIGLPVAVYYVPGNEFNRGFITLYASIVCFLYYHL